MTSIVFCILSFIAAFLLTRKSLRYGIIAAVAVGYFYGIVRANFTEVYSHFTFDAAVIGLFLGVLSRGLSAEQREQIRPLMPWIFILIAWPAFMCLLPIQDYLVQLVGLRANTFLLPFILVGAAIIREDRAYIGHWLAILNLVVFAFAIAEYFLGIERFYPPSEVTELIYRSRDVVGFEYHRIPATFSGAHAYGGTMTATLPWLVEALVVRGKSTRTRALYVAAIIASILGVFMCAARSPVLALFVLVAAALYFVRLKPKFVLLWIVVIGVAGYVVLVSERLQRFTTLEDTSYVSTRLTASVNTGFLEAMVDYPMGNGLGGGGSSMPYFLSGRLKSPRVIENEYARIMLEQGIPGLMLWLAFLAFLFVGTFALVRRRQTFSGEEMALLGTRLNWVKCMLTLALGATGLGMLASIPGTSLLLMSIGWIFVEARAQRTERLAIPTRREPSFTPVPYRADIPPSR